MTSLARRFLVVSAGMCLLLTGVPMSGSSAAGGPIVVNTVSNENNNDGDCSLREAISSANTDSRYDSCIAGSGADTILLPKGRFKLDTRVTVAHPLTIVGAGRLRTVVAAEQSDRVLSMGHTDLTLERLRITGGKTSSDGGGILNAGGSLTLVDASVTDSHATGNGGGIAATNGGDVHVVRSVISGNAAGQGGGGISAAGGSGDTSGVSVVGSTISGNTSDSAQGSIAGGGGIHLFHASALSAVRSTINGNHANVGGGVANESRAKFLNTTIADNAASGSNSRGGGVYSTGSVTVTNTTFDANRAGTGGNLYVASGSASFRNSLVGPAADGGNCGGDDPGDGGGNLEQGPNGGSCGFDLVTLGLGPLADNGGPTRTEALDRGSPAVDSARAPACPRTDQRGVPRQGSSCDSGAYELAACFGVPVDMVGTDGRDRIRGSSGPDSILGLGGDDRILGRGGNDDICAGAGNDILSGAEGADRLDGSNGHDTCNGGPANDRFLSCEVRQGQP
jgi:CSLREA domain-containing protein